MAARSTSLEDGTYIQGKGSLISSDTGSPNRTKILLASLVGGTVLFLVALTPVWDAFVLLNKGAYVYFLGRAELWRTIIFVGIVLGFYVITMIPLSFSSSFQSSRPAERASMYVILMSFTVLGLGFVTIGRPMQMRDQEMYDELLSSCRTGSRTKPLYKAWETLFALRQQPHCADKISVEDCHGYAEQQPYTGFLKFMEMHYECSGFCAGNNPHNRSWAPSSSTPPLSAVFAQQSAAEHSNKQASKIGSVQKHSLQTENTPPMWEQIPEGYGNTGNNMLATGWMSRYPPTLFTNANYKVSCDGAAAREIRFAGLESAVFMYWVGIGLLLVTVLAGLLNLGNLCRTAGKN